MASTELNTLYTSLNDDRDPLNTTQIIQWKGYRQWTKIGGYAGPILPCGHEKCIFVVFCAYNLYSVIMSVSWLHRFLIHDPCFPLQVAVLLMQLTSFMAYIFAFKALHPSTFQIDNFCVKPNRKTTALFIIPLIIVYLSGIATVCDYKGYSEYNGLQSIEYMIFIIGSEIFDGIRYVQLMVVSFIFHQILSSFPTKMISFDLHRLFGSNGPMKSAEIIECESMNHKSFMIPFSRMIAAYRMMEKQFWSFLVVLFVLNVLIWIGLLWNVVWRVDREAPCSTNSVLLDIHFGVEILYFVFMWIVLIWKLTLNQSLLRKYRNEFNTKVVVSDIQFSSEKLIIYHYLDTVVNDDSPFKIYGFTPSPSKMAWLLTAILGPMTYNVYRYAAATV